MHHQRGFTLIELMVAIAITALLLFAVIPDMSAWLRNTQIRNAGESMQNGLQLARMEAMKRNTNVTFWLVGQASNKVVDNNCALSSTSGSWVVSVDDPSSKCATAPSTTTAPRIVQTHAAGDGSRDVRVSALAADGATATSSITFNGFGQVPAGGTPIARLVLSHAKPDSRTLEVRVGTGGTVRMCDPSSNLSSTDPRKCP
jgi:type IV fimbrial biogenesis protein FimT